MTINHSSFINSISLNSKINNRATLLVKDHFTRFEHKDEQLVLENQDTPLISLSTINIVSKKHTGFIGGLNPQKELTIDGKR